MNIPAISAVCLLFLLSSFSAVFAQMDPQVSNEEYCKSLQPYKYKVSIQVTTIGEIDTKSSSYDLNFVLTVTSDDVDFTKCPPPSEWIFTNGYIESTWGQYTEPHFHKIHMHGIFFNEMNFRNYPFEDLVLSIEMGPPYPFTSKNTNFINNENYSGVSIAGKYLSGYMVGEPKIEVTEITTPWATFPHYTMSIPLTSDPGMVFLKKIFPVLILGGFGYAAYFMSPKVLQDRLAILGAVFVGAIFFHAALLLTEVPPVGYLTIADKIMVTIYSVFALVLLNILLQQKYLNSLEPDEKNYVIQISKRIDMKLIKLTPIFAVIIFFSLYFI